MAATMIFDLEVWVDGSDEPILVRADQRDLAAFELEYRQGTEYGFKNMTMVFMRYIAWAALKRLGKTEDSFDYWTETVVSVEEQDEEQDDEDDVAADPTSPAA